MAEITNGFFTALNDPKAAMWSAGVAFNRSNPLPLDKWSVFQTMDEANTYAESNAVAYPGQLIAAVDNGKMVALILAEDAEAGKLVPQQIGIIPTGEGAVSVDDNGKISIGVDGATIEIGEDGKLNLVGYESAPEGAQLLKQNGKLAWVKPDTTTVEGLNTTVESLDTAINGTKNEDGSRNEDGIAHKVAALESNLGNVYTKEETNNKINEEIGKKIHTEAKVVTSTTEMTEANIIYLLKVEDAKGKDVYEEYIVVDGAPVCIGDTTTSLEGYAKTSEVESAISNAIAEYKKTVDAVFEKIEEGAEVNVIDAVSEEFEISAEDRKLSVKEIAPDKITGLPAALQKIITDEERAKLATVSENAEPNYVKSVEESEFKVENGKLVLVSISQEKVANLGITLNSKVDKEDGKGLSANDFTDTLLEKLEGIEEGAKDNLIESIKANGVALDIADDKSVNIPLATLEAVGLVKSSEAENKVKVLEDGTMEINSVNVNKLVQDDNDVLILDGGTSAG